MGPVAWMVSLSRAHVHARVTGTSLYRPTTVSGLMRLRTMRSRSAALPVELIGHPGNGLDSLGLHADALLSRRSVLRHCLSDPFENLICPWGSRL